MRNKNRLQNLRSHRGGALVEFALVMPILMLLCVAAGDFGRLYFYGVTVVNAASSGVHWGSLDSGNAAQTGEVQNHALGDAGDLDSVSATATMYCDCPPADADDFTSEPTIVDCDLAGTPACTDGAYGFPRVYIRTDVTETFKTVGPYPGIPNSSVVGRSAFMRVQ